MITPVMDFVYALDIGTRSVVGLIAKPTPGGLEVIDAELIEHADRAMRDGQVHDVPEVARRVAQVTEALSSRTGLSLQRASVAAAGRALRTVEASAGVELDPRLPVSETLVRSLQLKAVSEAIAGLDDRFHCAGYSILRYRLDQDPIDNPIGQRGSRLDIDLIATFLPRVVTDALLEVLRQAGLSAETMTLEPIAAAHAAVPPTMRMLNLALVDVGAGTSDIALTRDGMIMGYAMVPQAGDSVTEAIAHAYLLDFPEAERAKRAWGMGQAARVTDVLGMEQELGTEAIAQAVVETVDGLAKRIAEQILGLGGKSPAAVLCIGGGSQTPGLAERIAHALGLSSTRVAVRGTELVRDMRPPAILEGPAGVTPLGIALTAHQHKGFRFVSATVGERSVQILDLGRATVLDALIAAGIPLKALIGQPGMGMTIWVEGTLRSLPGAMGSPAALWQDTEPAELDSPLKPGASIRWSDPTPGADAAARAADVLSAEPLEFLVNGERRRLEPRLLVNGQPSAPDRILADGDRLERDTTLGYALEAWGLRAPSSLRLSLNGKPIERETGHLRVNGESAPLSRSLKGSEIIEVLGGCPVTLADVMPAGSSAELNVTLNGQPIRLPVPGTLARVNGEVSSGDRELRNGDEVEIVHGPRAIMADLLPLIQSELIADSAPDRRLELTLDGLWAEFTTPVPPGSRIEARWVPLLERGYHG